MRTIQTARRSLPSVFYIDPPRIYDRPQRGADDLPSEVIEGFLEKLLGLPVEIFAEICAFLEPLDIRNLSISGRAFRSILMSRESRWIWVAARLRLYGPMPDPPNDMSEPQYTRFLFVPECFTCDGKATTIDHFNRIKSCTACYKDHFFTHQEAERLYPKFPVGHVRTPLPSSYRGSSAFIRAYHRSSIDPEYQLFLSQTSNGDETSLANYEAGLIERCSSILRDGIVIQKWMRAERTRQDKEFSDRCDKRERSIIDRMLKLGHEEDDIDLDVVKKLDLLRLPYDVTDTEWDSMRPALVEATVKRALRVGMAEDDPSESDS